MESEKGCVKVVMFPLLAHGHITPFLELAKGLSHRNFICYICSTPANLSSISDRIPAKYSSSIHLLHLDLPPSPEFPPHYHTTNGLPLRLHDALKTAVRAARPRFLNLVKALKADLLIHDVMQAWAAATASALDIPAVAFYTSGAATLSYFRHLEKHRGVDFPFAATRLTGFQLSATIAVLDAYESEEKEPDEDACLRSEGITLMNTCREMEGIYLDHLSETMERKVVPIGACVQDSSVESNNDDNELMEWLDQKDEFSTVFVSFGSEYFLKREEIEEIANGLEMSHVSFIWIIRFPKGEEINLDEALPLGFIERVGERGKIVENWAPQTRILGHRSVGGFVSHCGWNSLKESICFGVPIIAVPMHIDQPVNAKLALELGVGVEVKRGDGGRILKEEISNAIKDVVGVAGEVLRRRVGEVRERIRCRSIEEIKGVADLLAKLCGKTTISE